MTTWQSQLVEKEYSLVFAEPPKALDAPSFWRTIEELCPSSTLILLGGSHADLAPFLAHNLARYRCTWTLVSTCRPKDSGLRNPHRRTRVLHLFCAQ